MRMRKMMVHVLVVEEIAVAKRVAAESEMKVPWLVKLWACLILTLGTTRTLS